jgi:anti-anti-sigma regulatory factor
MKIISMVKYGRTLTDREYGKSVSQTLIRENGFPMTLDFQGVMALGSSCGDEIVNAIGILQNREIRVLNVNQAVRACLEKVAEDTKVKVVFASA